MQRLRLHAAQNPAYRPVRQSSKSFTSFLLCSIRPCAEWPSHSLTSRKSMHYCSGSKIGFAHAQNTRTTRAFLAARAIPPGLNAPCDFCFGAEPAADAADQFAGCSDHRPNLATRQLEI